MLQSCLTIDLRAVYLKMEPDDIVVQPQSLERETFYASGAIQCAKISSSWSSMLTILNVESRVSLCHSFAKVYIVGLLLVPLALDNIYSTLAEVKSWKSKAIKSHILLSINFHFLPLLQIKSITNMDTEDQSSNSSGRSSPSFERPTTPMVRSSTPLTEPFTPPSAGRSEPKSDPPTPLVKLQTKDHENILNVIDQLRLEGISTYINLPQLIVCGDQSSGKSSVLEAISGLKFPAEDDTCTRFATELILRRASETALKATIQPDNGRPSKDKEVIRRYKLSNVGLENFANIVKEAGEFLGVGRDNRAFSRDILRVEVSGPDQPHLTLVDLPGLYSGTDKKQGKTDAQFVDSLVCSYMSNKRSLILAVVSAKSDIALQKITTFTDDVDPTGERIMGIITKPDTLSKESNMERNFYELAMNKRRNFRLGWHVLKNRDYEQRHFTLEQRNASETEFLNSGIWASLPPTRKCIDSLRPRLSLILKDHIIAQLPTFITETQEAFNEAKEQLEKMGKSRCNINDQRRYLLRSSERFASLIASAIEPAYNDAYFGDAMSDEGYQKRLCTVVQNRLWDFNREMSKHGQQEKIVGDTVALKDGQINRSKFVEKVQQRIRRSRGRELPGTFNPLVIGDLFHTQCKPWETIVNKYTEQILTDIRKAVIPALREVLDEKSLDGLLEHVINPSLERLGDMLRAGTSELLEPHQTGHPITYNHYFTENIQKARQAHFRQTTINILKEFFGPYYDQGQMGQSPAFEMNDLVNALSAQSEADMERFACSEAVDCMVAYYKV